MRDLRAQYGQYALVTGASAGIGEQFAVQLAEAGFDLVLVARRKEKLDALAVDLRSQFGVAVEVVELDLDTENASAALLTRTQHLDIGIAVLSAGIFTSGPFVGNTLAGIDSALMGLGKASVHDLSRDDIVIPPGFTRTLGALPDPGL